MQTIIIKQPNGSISTTKCAEGVDVEAHAIILADSNTYKIVNDTDLPTVNEFRDAWELKAGVVKTNLVKAKVIAHDVRRMLRDEAFLPLDRQATVPSLQAVAEASRQAIRDADALKQIAIDKSKNEADLLAAYNG